MQTTTQVSDNLDLDLNQLGLETKERKHSSVRQAAESAFSDHILARMDTHWECFNKTSYFYSFKIALMPGAIVLWGDIGSMIIDAGDDYNLDWMVRYVNSIHYFLGKCSAAKRNYYYSGEFQKYIFDNNNPEVLAYLENDWSEYSYFRYQMKYSDSDAREHVYGYTPAALWAHQAFKKFIELYLAQTNNAIHQDIQRSSSNLGTG